MKLITLVFGMVVIVVAVMAAAQAPAQKPKFEVASVKLNKTGASLPTRTIIPGSLIYMDVVLAEYIQLAYGLQYRQLEGPREIFEDRYDISAKAAGPAGPDEIKLMLRTLLEDRLQMRFHMESHEMAVNVLTIAKNGPTFHPSTGDGPLERRITRDAYEFRNASMADLVELINNVGDRFVIDRTGLEGHYDFDFKLYDMYIPSKTDPIPDIKRNMADAIAASIPSAVQSLGLRLEGQKSMVEVLVVDSVSRPSEN
jgi:uncharacterized protein (TIGR03435 family)